MVTINISLRVENPHLVIPVLLVEDLIGQIDQGLKTVVQPIIDDNSFEGKHGQVYTTHVANESYTRLTLVGIGNPADLTIEQTRRAFGYLGDHLRGSKRTDISIDCAFLTTVDNVQTYCEALIEGLLLGNYRFDQLKTNDKKKNPPLKSVNLVLGSEWHDQVESAIQYSLATTQGTVLARDLGNKPSNIATPAHLAEEALKLSELGLVITVLEADDIQKERMGLFWATAKASADHDPPKFIIMDYTPPNPQKTLCLVGKGITFDTGGITLKPGAAMGEMIYDMCGAGAVIGAMKTIALLKPQNIRVVGLVPSTPNMPGGGAYRPGDILTSRSGKTVEIISTDAEGRHLLADALDYAKKYQPDLVFDFATLTGSVVVGLGHFNAGFFINKEAEDLEGLNQLIFKTGRQTGDWVWQLPLDNDYLVQLRSNHADLKHSGGRPGGTITAAMFLSQFTAYPWVHFDIAGTGWSNSKRFAKHYLSHMGATGFGVRLVSEFIRQWS